MVSVGHGDGSRSVCAESCRLGRALQSIRPAGRRRRLRNAICKFLLLVRCNACMASGVRSAIKWERCHFLFTYKDVFVRKMFHGAWFGK